MIHAIFEYKRFYYRFFICIMGVVYTIYFVVFYSGCFLKLIKPRLKHIGRDGKGCCVLICWDGIYTDKTICTFPWYYQKNKK